ncbi:MAG: pilin [Candidatus Spechtbacterales bacterium]
MKKSFLPALILVPILAITLFFAFAPDAQAALVQCGGKGQEPCTFCDFFVLLHNIIEFALFQLGPALVALMIMIGGFLIITGAGNPSQVNNGMNTIKWAVLGYLLMMVSWVIVNTIFIVLDFNTSWSGLEKWYEIQCR